MGLHPTANPRATIEQCVVFTLWYDDDYEFQGTSEKRGSGSDRTVRNVREDRRKSY